VLIGTGVVCRDRHRRGVGSNGSPVLDRDLAVTATTI
jgi:hypothetical protein